MTGFGDCGFKVYCVGPYPFQGRSGFRGFSSAGNVASDLDVRVFWCSLGLSDIFVKPRTRIFFLYQRLQPSIVTSYSCCTGIGWPGFLGSPTESMDISPSTQRCVLPKKSKTSVQVKWLRLRAKSIKTEKRRVTRDVSALLFYYLLIVLVVGHNTPQNWSNTDGRAMSRCYLQVPMFRTRTGRSWWPGKNSLEERRLGEGVQDVRMPRPWFIWGEACFTVYCVALCVYDVILFIL